VRWTRRWPAERSWSSIRTRADIGPTIPGADATTPPKTASTVRDWPSTASLRSTVVDQGPSAVTSAFAWTVKAEDS
jgi:hypothetical protein